MSSGQWAVANPSISGVARRDIPSSSRIAVVGSGYVGTVVACCFAWLGHRVVGVETDPRKLHALRAGCLPFHEPGLANLLAAGLQNGSLHFTDDYADALRSVEAVFLCVGTPSAPDGSVDTRAIEAAVQAVGRALSTQAVIVTKSTIPIGGARRLIAVLKGALGQRNGDAPTVRLVHNPEFLREGSAVRDFLHPDRVVLGSDEAEALQVVNRLYRQILDQSFPGGEPNRLPGILTTDVVTAEAIKYACNAFLATKISFINEMARICDLVGADIEDVAIGMGLDQRIAPQFLKAGLGWGGSCFAKDLSALISTARPGATGTSPISCPPPCWSTSVNEPLRSSDSPWSWARWRDLGSDCWGSLSSPAPTTSATHPPSTWRHDCSIVAPQ
jgi:UDPglucose 6-dehydrogenase